MNFSRIPMLTHIVPTSTGTLTDSQIVILGRWSWYDTVPWNDLTSAQLKWHQ